MHIPISQDTVIGLQALSEFAELIYTPDIDFTVELTSTVDPNFRKTITVNQQNSLVLHLVEVILCAYHRLFVRNVKLQMLKQGFSNSLVGVKARQKLEHSPSGCRPRLKNVCA